MYEAELMDFWPCRALAVRSRGWPRRLEFFNQTLTRHGLKEENFSASKPGREGALALYRQYALPRGATIMGEKAPAYYARLPMLGKTFPEARFLIIWRDPAECCRSAARAGRNNRFFAQRGMMTRMLLGSETLAEGVEWLLREKRSVHEVVYNELVENPEGELRRACRFLAIPFVPEMLDLGTADLSSLPSGEHHAGVRAGGIRKSHESDDALPAAFLTKCRGYAKLWQKRFSQLGFARALVPEPESVEPTLAARLADRCACLLWRLVDWAKQFLFRNIPLSCWSWLRSATPRANETPLAKGESKP
jgi:hypothetical protein